MKTLITTTLLGSLLLFPDLASADKKGKGPKANIKQQEKWSKEELKRDDKYWKAVEKDRKEFWKRYPYHDPYFVPPYRPIPEPEGYFGSRPF